MFSSALYDNEMYKDSDFEEPRGMSMRPAYDEVVIGSVECTLRWAFSERELCATYNVFKICLRLITDIDMTTP